MAAAAGVLAGAGGAVAPSAGEASAEELLARALEVIDWQWARIDELAGQNAELREENAQLVRASEELRELVGDQAARLAEVNETVAVLQRMVFGRKSEKNRPGPPAGSSSCCCAEAPQTRDHNRTSANYGPEAKGDRDGIEGRSRRSVAIASYPLGTADEPTRETRDYQPRGKVTREERTYSPGSDPTGSLFLQDVARGFVYGDSRANSRLSRHPGLPDGRPAPGAGLHAGPGSPGRPGGRLLIACARRPCSAWREP